MNSPNGNRPQSSDWRDQLYTIIYEADTRGGKLFDVALLINIGLSVLAVALESVESIALAYGPTLRAIEWVFTILFTAEYILRLIAVERPLHYARSFFGIIDLLATFPTYLALLIPGAQTLLIIRILRLLRIFRVFNMANYLQEAESLRSALWASRRKIVVFLAAVLTSVVIIGSLMYVIEGEESGFTSIPVGVYWAIVTLSTVGYGDVAPITPLGQVIASIVMLLGFGIIAVPTGIVSLELARPSGIRSNTIRQAESASSKIAQKIAPRSAIDIGIVVADMERSLNFYRDLLGVPIVAETQTSLIGEGRMVQLQHGVSLIKLVKLTTVPPDQSPMEISAATGYRYITLLVADITAILADIEQVGIRVTQPLIKLANGTQIAMVADPDGNIVEFVQEAQV